VAVRAVLDGEPVAPTLVAMAAEHAGSLIVLATRARAGVARWLLGSVAEGVVREATLPVLVVPPEVAAWPTDRPLRVLVPLESR